MSDSAVARVLWALERVASELVNAETAELLAERARERHWDTWTLEEMRDFNTETSLSLGRVQGLVAAQLLVTTAIVDYRRKHSATRGGLQAQRLASLVEEGPAGRDL